MRVTINNINKALPEGYSLIRDRNNDCFYFIYPDNVTWYNSCIYTNLLGCKTVIEWVELFNDMREDNEQSIRS